MSLQSRLQKLESVRTTIRVRHWFWDSMPDRIEVDGTTFDRLPGESDDGMRAWISRRSPQAEIVAFRWLASETNCE
jgi:predicted DNA-binding ribbon-helix-helix protein